jgi:hypothetical protein
MKWVAVKARERPERGWGLGMDFGKKDGEVSKGGEQGR